MHHLMFIAVCLIWGSNFILMKWAHALFGPTSVAAGRVLGGAAVLWAVWLLQRRSPTRARVTLSPGDRAALMVPVLIGSVYPYIMQPYLIGKHHDSAFFGMMVALVPLLTVLASVPLLRIWPRKCELAGVLLGLACLAVLMRDGGLRGMPPRDLVLAALVPASYAVNNTYLKRRLSHLPPLYMTAVILGLTSLVLTPVGAATEALKPADTATTLEALAATAWLGAVGTGLAVVMFYRLIQVHGPLYAGMVAYVIPVIALAWGWLDGETVSAAQLVALAGVLTSVAMVQWRPGKPRTARR